MKEKANLQQFLVTILLFLAGILSPSNGVDDRTHKTPLELIVTTLGVVSAGLVVYFLWDWIEKYRASVRVNYKSTDENNLTSN